ncbi:MAG: thioredoxin [Aggregatilineales bacterium]
MDTKPVTVTDATFEQEVLAYPLPVVVDFWAPWCGPCRMVAPILDKLAKEFAGKVRIAKVNTDENPGLAQAFQIMSIPTIMMVKERTIVFSQPGALPESALRDLIQQLIALQIPAEHKRQRETAPADKPKR